MESIHSRSYTYIMKIYIQTGEVFDTILDTKEIVEAESVTNVMTSLLILVIVGLGQVNDTLELKESSIRC